MEIRTFLLMAMVAFLSALVGCNGTTPAPPVNLAEHERQQKVDPNAFTNRVIVLYNVRRVSDADLAPEDRLASLKLLVELDAADADVYRQLATVLSDTAAPPEVRQGVLAFLLKKDYPGLGPYVAESMGQLAPDSTLRTSLLGWLERHPRPEVLGDVVAAWARQPSTTGPAEPRFRLVIERISGQRWDEALIAALNRPGFARPVEAYELLVRRLNSGLLGRRIAAAQAVTDPMAALQAFMLHFNYVPPNREAYQEVDHAYRSHGRSLPAAADLAGQWREDSGYIFDIRDFHLLSRLASDPLRKRLSHRELSASISKLIGARRHVRWRGIGGIVTDRFAVHATSLSMADLWNLHLLGEMLARPRTQIFVSIIAARDREDRGGAWGGLVSYRAGGAEARIYPVDPGVSDDTTYAPNPTADGRFNFDADRRDALCRFICRFERADNARRAGPTATDLRDARRDNHYGLVLTSISRTEFCAHYYNTSGNVVSLGVFAMGK